MSTLKYLSSCGLIGDGVGTSHCELIRPRWVICYGGLNIIVLDIFSYVVQTTF